MTGEEYVLACNLTKIGQAYNILKGVLIMDDAIDEQEFRDVLIYLQDKEIALREKVVELMADED